MSASTRSQISVQQDLLETALARLQALEDSQQQLVAENAALRQELNTRPAREASPSHHTPKEPKVSAPEAFHGREKTKLPAFLLGLNIVFNTQASRYPDDLTKINYAISFLRDDAIAWVTPFSNKPAVEQPAWLSSYDLFVEELKTMFGDPDEVATAERQIRVLRQRGPASAYFAEFRRLAAVLGWNDTALASQAYTGLKDSIKDELARIGRPTSLGALIETATRLDNRLFERQTERERSNNISNKNVTATAQTTRNFVSTPTGGKTVTTQVIKKEFVPASGAPTRRGPLTDQEKERRRREGLCLYCGQAGHALDTCPVAPRSSSTNNRPSGPPARPGN